MLYFVEHLLYYLKNPILLKILHLNVIIISKNKRIHDINNEKKQFLIKRELIQAKYVFSEKKLN